jgi:hypothetical protein
VVDLLHRLAVERAAREGGIAVHARGELTARPGIVLVTVPRGVEFSGEQVAVILIAHVVKNGEGLRDRQAGVVLGGVDDRQELRVGHVVGVVCPEPRAADVAAEVLGAAGRRFRRGRGPGRSRGRRTTLDRAVYGENDLIHTYVPIAVSITGTGVRSTAEERAIDEHQQLADRHIAAFVDVAGAQMLCPGMRGQREQPRDADGQHHASGPLLPPPSHRR